LAQRARGRATGTRTNRDARVISCRQHIHARVCPAAASETRVSACVSSRITTHSRGPRADHRPAPPRSPAAPPRPQRPCKSRGHHLRRTTRTTLRPPMRPQPLHWLGARVGSPCAPAPCALYTARARALSCWQAQPMLIMPRPACTHTCRGSRAADAAEAQDPR